MALATSSRSPNSWLISLRYGVSPQPAQAPENSIGRGYRLRMVKLQQEISGCWRTLAGAEAFLASAAMSPPRPSRA